MDFKKLIDEIPAYDHFLTVDEMDASTLKLAEDYPDLVSVTQEGTSRGGHPRRPEERLYVRLSASERTDGRDDAGIFLTPFMRR